MSGRRGHVRPERRFALLALYQFDSGLAGDLDAVREALESAAEIDEFGESPDLSTAEARLAAFVMLARRADAHTHHARRLLDGEILVKHEMQHLRLPRGQFFQGLAQRACLPRRVRHRAQGAHRGCASHGTTASRFLEGPIHHASGEGPHAVAARQFLGELAPGIHADGRFVCLDAQHLRDVRQAAAHGRGLPPFACHRLGDFVGNPHHEREFRRASGAIVCRLHHRGQTPGLH